MNMRHGSKRAIVCSVVWVISVYGPQSVGADESDNIVVSCRAVDTDGRPIAGVNCNVRRIPFLDEDGHPIHVNPPFYKLPATNENGQATSEELKTGRSYTFEFSKDGFVPACSRRSHLEAKGKIRLPDVVLRRLRDVKGIVRDNAGKPVAGVRVLQSGDGPKPTETQSAADGTFQISGVPEGLALIFADHADYWFTGRRAPTGDAPLEIVLTPRSQPNAEQCDVSLKPPRPKATVKEEETQAARDTLAESFRTAVRKDERTVYSLANQLARTDYLHALRVFAETEMPAELRGYTLQYVVANELQDDFENGMARLGQMTGAQKRAETLLYYTLPEPDFSDEQKRILVARVITELRNIDDPLTRLSHTSRLLNSLHQLGANDELRQLVNDAVELLDGAGDGETIKHQYGTLAEQVAPIDPVFALQLMERGSPMFRAWVAIGIADKEPEKAEKLLREYSFAAIGGSRRGRVYVLPRACYRMAHIDPDRALSLVELMDGIVQSTPRYTIWDAQKTEGSLTDSAKKRLQQFTGLIGLSSKRKPETDPVAILFKSKLRGLIAEVMADTEPRRAEELLLSTARDIMPITRGIVNERGGWRHSPCSFMASLVSPAASVNSGLAAELCWRSLAKRIFLHGTDNPHAGVVAAGDMQALVMLSTLDKALAEELIDQYAARSVARSFDGAAINYWEPGVWSQVNPQRGHEWSSRYCPKGKDNAPSPRKKMQESTLRILAAPNDETYTVIRFAERRLESIQWMHVVVDREQLHPGKKKLVQQASD